MDGTPEPEVEVPEGCAHNVPGGAPCGQEVVRTVPVTVWVNTAGVFGPGGGTSVVVEVGLCKEHGAMLDRIAATGLGYLSFR